MPDVVSPEVRSRMMSGIRGKDTKPELVLRHALHRDGFRYRLHVKDLPGRPDLVFPRFKAVVFINGCFWHGHQGCKYFKVPSTRTEFWVQKINGNRVRDQVRRDQLEHSGWRTAIVWECAMRHQESDAVVQVERWLSSQQARLDISWS